MDEDTKHERNIHGEEFTQISDITGGAGASEFLGSFDFTYKTKTPTQGFCHYGLSIDREFVTLKLICGLIFFLSIIGM